TTNHIDGFVSNSLHPPFLPHRITSSCSVGNIQESRADEPKEIFWETASDSASSQGLLQREEDKRKQRKSENEGGGRNIQERKIESPGPLSCSSLLAFSQT
ncbi:50S ribosomal protein L31, partial [Dissostichus eleginoides]